MTFSTYNIGIMLREHKSVIKADNIVSYNLLISSLIFCLKSCNIVLLDNFDTGTHFVHTFYHSLWRKREARLFDV